MPSRAFLVHELVDVQVGDHRPRDLVVGAIGFLPGAHALAVRLPEVRRQRREPGVEHVGVFDGLVAVVVLGVHADHRCLDAQVDVLGHQRDARLVVQRLQRQGLRKDGVVGAVARVDSLAGRRRAAGSGRRAARAGAAPGAPILAVAVDFATSDDPGRVGSGRPLSIWSLVASRIRSSRKRLTWRTLREASDRPFLLASSSSSTTMGR